MAKRIVQDQVFLIEQVTDGCDVGGMPAYKNNSGLDPDMPGKSCSSLR